MKEENKIFLKVLRDNLLEDDEEVPRDMKEDIKELIKYIKKEDPCFWDIVKFYSEVAECDIYGAIMELIGMWLGCPPMPKDVEEQRTIIGMTAYMRTVKEIVWFGKEEIIEHGSEARRRLKFEGKDDETGNNTSGCEKCERERL